MIHGLVGEAQDELFGKLMMVDIDSEHQVDPTQVPAIHWDSMVDNPTESRVGWSFLDDERNKFDVDGQWWLYERMFKEQKLREHFLDRDSPQLQYNDEAVATYQRSIKRFQELLLCLLHTVSGQPARATEILGVRWKNTEQGGVRNIFIEDGLVSLVISYHKGYMNSGNLKIIHRYLPKEIGELLVYYLWLVRPFYEKLQFQANRKRCNSAFLWGDSKKVDHKQWTGPKKRRNNRRDREGSSGSSSSSSKEQDIPEMDWSSERMRKALQSASLRWMGVKLHIAAWRHIAIAISRRYCQKNQFWVEEQGQDKANEWEEHEDNP